MQHWPSAFMIIIFNAQFEYSETLFELVEFFEPLKNIRPQEVTVLKAPG